MTLAWPTTCIISSKNGKKEMNVEKWNFLFSLLYYDYPICPGFAVSREAWLLVIILVCVCCALLSHSVVSNSEIPQTVAHQAPLSTRILQARILEWVAISSFRGSSQPRDRIRVPALQVDSLPAELPRKLLYQLTACTRKAFYRLCGWCTSLLGLP